MSRLDDEGHVIDEPVRPAFEDLQDPHEAEGIEPQDAQKAPKP